MVSIPRLVIAAPASGHGKTTVATGLLAALTARGVRATGAKVGPDYIDPSYHALACERPGRNLDPVLLGTDLIGPLFAHGAAGAEIAIIEGVMGLFDGRASDGAGSTAQVAQLLDAPVVLVVDATGQGRSLAALLHGFRSFDSGVRLAGVILNRVGSDRHEEILRAACEEVALPVLGVLRRSAPGAAEVVPSRHLGLIPAAEANHAACAAVAAMGELVARGVDMEALLAVARTAPPLPSALESGAFPATPWGSQPPWSPVAAAAASQVTVAVAGGPAFTFGYAEQAELLRAAGADVAQFDPLQDEKLPPGTAAVIAGGGFPEEHAAELAANVPLRQAVRELAASGAPIAAECGGLLWLGRTLRDGTGTSHEMCGVLDIAGAMSPRLTLGYRDAVAISDSVLADQGTRVTGHEFHRTTVTPPAGAQPAWAWSPDIREGFVAGTVHASYLHTHWAAYPQFAARLVAAAARVGAAGTVTACG